MSYHTLQRAYAKVSRLGQTFALRWPGVSRGVIPAGRCGFFGNMFMTLNAIRFCESLGVRPEPVWGPESLFYDAARGENAWAYYFQPVPPLDGVLPRPGGRALRLRPSSAVIRPTYPGRTVRRTYAEVIRRYVHLRPELATEFDRLAGDLFEGRPVVGVHLRFTDATSGVENRRHFQFEQYFAAVDEQLAVRPGACVFVATDSTSALDAARQRYGDLVRALDCIRSDGTTSIHGHYDAGVPGSPYQKGLEVVRDAYMLARVDHLIRANSGVTLYSLCVSPSLAFTEIGEGTIQQRLAPSPWLLDDMNA